MWRFVHTGDRSPAENMAIDEAILVAHQEGLVPPTVRFYGWNPATLSIGYFQQASKEVSFEALLEHGLGFVRRATGGRAVLHDRELTYSIVVSENYPGIPTSVAEAYRVLSKGLLNGFRKLGLDAVMTGTEARSDEEAVAGSPLSAACFDSPSKYELVVEGKKIAGSAQMRSGGVILQHGSILLELDSDQLFDVLHFEEPSDKLRMKKIFERKAVAINDCLRRKSMPPVTIRDLEESFRAGFSEELDTDLTAGELTDYEMELASRLAREKYGSDSWNLRR
ncbi:lipoate--protein ligase family protein [Cohnella soli]|uniref:Biotin/lipoate A/B protein ligase family protein n=1 Tax=Cohnella soli TaxID=425005 RepID=A0ABW0HUK3_9BACL